MDKILQPEIDLAPRMYSIYKVTVIILATLACFFSNAQETSADLEFRFNPIYSLGYREPLFEGEKPGFFTMQRTRLILNYNNPDSLKAKVVIQDRRVWGEVSERADTPELGIFRAWIEQNITDNVSIKLGRQGLVYDDEHLFGELNWGGTLAHDVAITKYKKEDFEAHLGLAFNANRINQLKNEFFLPNLYKNMQFLWMHKDYKKLKSSIIFINRGLQESDTTINYTQTFGTNTSFILSKRLTLKGIYYHQIGRDIDDREVNANFWSAQLLFKPSSKIDLTFGIESTSGTDQRIYNDSTLRKSSTFDIHYGLRHAHYGYIDYFYVLQDPVVFGIVDYYIKSDFKLGTRWKIRNNIHIYTTAAQAYSVGDALFQNPISDYLGVENDFKITFKPTKTFKASFGHSIFFGTKTLKEYFGGRPIKDSQFLYMVITASPRIFTSK